MLGTLALINTISIAKVYLDAVATIPAKNGHECRYAHRCRYAPPGRRMLCPPDVGMSTDAISRYAQAR
jgi:hypothetical protein